MTRPPDTTVLLHACCGPCLLGVAPELLRRGERVHAWFANPNIHGLLEFRRRLSAFLQAAAVLKLPETHDSAYGLTRFLRAWASDPKRRCIECYRMRLDAAATEAGRLGLRYMTTTLLVSPHQDRNAVVEAGMQAAQAADIEFIGDDLRHLNATAIAEARHHSLYRQQYCGCIFSEEDRYRGTGKYLPKSDWTSSSSDADT